MLGSLLGDELKNYCKAIAGHLGEDLLQEVYIVYIENEEIVKNHNAPLAWAKKVAKNIFFNKRNAFNRIHSPKAINPEDFILVNYTEDVVDERLTFILEELKKPARTKGQKFNKDVFLESQKLGSVRKLSEETNINRNTLSKAAKRYKDEVRNNYKNSRR